MRKTNPAFDNEFKRIADPAIWLGWSNEKHSNSKLGGLPWLPDASLWPRHWEFDTPLHFLCQLDLAQLPTGSLRSSKRWKGMPKTGMLFFFANMDSEQLWLDYGLQSATRVIYAETVGAPVPAPDDLPTIRNEPEEEGGIRVFPERWLEAVPIDFYPHKAHARSPAWAEADLRHVENVGLGRSSPPPEAMSHEEIRAMPDEERAAQVKWQNACPAMFSKGRNGSWNAARFTSHAFMASPFDGRHDSSSDVEEGAIALLQLDSDRAVHRNFMFCDVGKSQFWITPEDLEAGRFEHAWGTTDCC